jgi:hypothetical protein
MYNQPSGHPAICPQSDGRRLVFPLSQWSGTFKTTHFLPSIVDYRCSLDDIHLFLNDVYYATKRLKPIRLANRLILWSFIMYLFCFVFGIMIEIDNQDSITYYEVEGENKYQYAEQDDTGIFMILGGMFILIFINIWALVYRNQAKTELFKQIVHVLERHKYIFLQKGLRWAIPENCQWLELWMDYRFFSPYYMQPYVPSMPSQCNTVQALTHGQAQGVPVGQNNNTSNSNANNQSGQQLQQGYPVFEMPSVQGGQTAGDSANVNVNRVGFVQGVPQFYAGQPQLGYGYYQNPQLNETLLGYQIPVQENDNLRLMRSY